MKKIVFVLLTIFVSASILSCSDDETYANKRKKERSAISQYIADSAVNVISEEQFNMQDSTTDVSKNQFVLFKSSGIYMQIIRKGSGEKLKKGTRANVLCRYTEVNLFTDSILTTNDIVSYAYYLDKMSVYNNSGTIEGSFLSGVMYAAYGASVPQGWLLPLKYINLGRQSEQGIAKVKVIVPSTMGQKTANSNVYPCLYTITYQLGR